MRFCQHFPTCQNLPTSLPCPSMKSTACNDFSVNSYPQEPWQFSRTQSLSGNFSFHVKTFHCPLIISPLFFLKTYLYFVMSVCLHVYMCTMYRPDAPGGQKRASELQMVVRCQVGAGNKPASSARAASTLDH